ncbi:MAG: leucyl aminopeptidase [Alphaproteobacteria bacterium]|nr:MAG: leucyl aminopeptidase [Alphaproteobacteria bacterium]
MKIKLFKRYFKIDNVVYKQLTFRGYSKKNMRPHKISIKRKKNFNLRYQKNKFVLFLKEDGRLDNDLPLDNHISELIKKFIRTEVFKNLAFNSSISIDNPITLEPSTILIVKVKNFVGDQELFDFGKIISSFKDGNAVSIIWSIDKPFISTLRTVQLRSYVFNKLKSRPKGSKDSAETTFFLDEKFKFSKLDLQRNDALADGVFLSRDLVNLPANILNTETFEKELKKFKKIGIKVRVLNEKDIKAIGMNLLFAVGKGSSNPSKVLVLEWKGGKSGTQPTALVGKGVVFDSGGLSLKSSSGMVDMAMDMAGAAVVAGVIKSVAQSNLKVNLVGLIGLVENMPGPSAMRPGDVIKSLKGDLVQVNNTDAEGRLVLGDLLWYAQQKFKPKRIFDLATLTGAIIVALGKEYAGVFSNNDKFCDEFLSVCDQSNEKAWRLPLDKKFGDALSSKITDITNVGGSQGSSIVAAMFLNNFVKKETPWIHLDVAGVAKNTETIYSKNGATAWGVVALFEYFQRFP